MLCQSMPIILSTKWFRLRQISQMLLSKIMNEACGVYNSYNNNEDNLSDIGDISYSH